MGIGPVPATRRALAAAQLEIGDVGLVELNEAFAAQAVACQEQLGIPDHKLNVKGGAIALGHPLGSSGSRLVITLLREMQRRRVRYGLATMCIGVGQGIATIWELPESAREQGLTGRTDAVAKRRPPARSAAAKAASD
jgi:acetyl-CoA acetyltransferase